jgi:hypothetical protein
MVLQLLQGCDNPILNAPIAQFLSLFEGHLVELNG